MSFFDRFRRKNKEEEVNLLISGDKIRKFAEEDNNRLADAAVDDAIRRKQEAEIRRRQAERRRIEDEIVSEGEAEEAKEAAKRGRDFFNKLENERYEEEHMPERKRLTKEYNEYNKKNYLPPPPAPWMQSPPRKGEVKCPKCGALYDQNKENCPYCGEGNEFILKPGKMFCQYCRKKISVNDRFCGQREVGGKATPEDARKAGYCGRENPGYQSIDNLGKSTQKNIRGKLSEIIIYELAGIFVLVGLPFFGFPSMPLLAVVLMALFPFYSFLPNERQALASREAGGVSLGAWAAGSLMLKGIVKMTAFVLTVLQFIILPVSRLIPLAISFVYYFTLPVEYKVTQPFKMIEAWFRIGVGGLIAWFIWMAFSGSPQAITLTLMSAAFFVTSFPHHKEAEEEQNVVRIKIEALKKYSEYKGSEIIMKIIFLGFMLAAYLIGITSGGIGFGLGGFQLIFLVVWLMSVVSGWAAGSEGRPALGILMIGITLFVFSFTATGVIGQAIFGYWWPQIQSAGEVITAPLGSMWTQVQSTMSDSWLMLSNPMGYYNKMQQQQQATASVVQSGGSVKSIELTKTDLFTSVSGQLEPRLDPLIGSFEIQNQGEFDASNIKLDLWASWTNPTATSATNPTAPIKVGSLDYSKFSCSKPFDSATSTSGKTGSGDTGICDWSSTTYPQEIKVVNFIFDKGTWGSLANCVVKDSAGKITCPTNGDTSCCSDPDATYALSGQTVKVNAELTYDYNVNVSIPVDVINFSTYQDMLQAKEITLQELTSQYTGGPVKATLWSQRQPIRSGESSLFVASIYNDGQGNITKVNSFVIKILASLGNVQKVSSTFYSGSIGTDACTPAQKVENGAYWEIDCSYDVPDHSIMAGDYARVSFLITPPENLGVDKISRLIIGLANYEYVKTASTSITIANNPLH